MKSSLISSIIFSILILTACASPSPQVTVTSPPTETPTATETPEPQLSPEFNKIQEEIARSEDYILNTKGEIEMQTDEGVVILPNIKISTENGTMTVTNEEAEIFGADPETIKIDGQIFTFIDNEGRTWIWDGNTLVEGVISPPELQEKLDKAGIKLEDLGKPEKDGLHITLESGEAVISYEDLNKNSYLGQNNVYQYRNIENTQVLYAFDKENKTLLEASKHIQDSGVDEEKFIQAESFDDLPEIFRREKLFLIPFDPENTYFPNLDDIYVNYNTPENYGKFSYNGEFNHTHPFGNLPSSMDSPFKIVNYIRIQNIEDGPYDFRYIASQQVYNPSDKSFSVLHYITDQKVIPEIAMDGNRIIRLPALFISAANINYNPKTAILNYYRKNGLMETNGKTTLIASLVRNWLEEGKVPQELENIPCFPVIKLLK